MLELLTLLNPKTTTFEVAGTGSLRTITQADICSALSYSKMPKLSHDLMRAKWLNDNHQYHLVRLAKELIKNHPCPQHQDNIALVEQCAMVALIEFCVVKHDYRPSGRQRAKLLNIPSTTYQRKQLDKLIDDYSHFVNDYYAVGCALLKPQLELLVKDELIQEDG